MNDLFPWDKTISQEPKYRQLQVKKAVFQELISDWQEASNLPLIIRERLNQEALLVSSSKYSLQKSSGTSKTLIILPDKLQIETVLMRHADGRNTICVSSQVGCPIGCQFCATGQLGFKRNLTAWEIINQVLFWARRLKEENQKVTNLVFMGMGEPFLNYDQVIVAIRVFNDPTAFNLGARHISISTVGIIEGIKKLSQEKLQVNLAFSLHAPFDQLRCQLIPIASKYPLSKILDTIDDYIRKTKRQVMLEYLLIKEVNDTAECLSALIEIMRRNSLYFLNLILYNPTQNFQPSSFHTVKKWKDVLTQKKIKFSQRYRFGQEIEAACGQLAAKNYQQEK